MCTRIFNRYIVFRKSLTFSERWELGIKPAYALDSIDLAIVNCVSRNGRLSYVEIAGMVGVSEGTVRNHIQRMVEAGVLSFIGVIDPFRTGLSTLALIGLRVGVRNLDAVCHQLSEFREVRFVVACSGAFNVMIEVAVDSSEELVDFVTKELSTVEGIEHVEMSQELKLYKNSFNFVEGGPT